MSWYKTKKSRYMPNMNAKGKEIFHILKIPICVYLLSMRSDINSSNWQVIYHYVKLLIRLYGARQSLRRIKIGTKHAWELILIVRS